LEGFRVIGTFVHHLPKSYWKVCS
jgi:hypothetical protein